LLEKYKPKEINKCFDSTTSFVVSLKLYSNKMDIRRFFSSPAATTTATATATDPEYSNGKRLDTEDKEVFLTTKDKKLTFELPSFLFKGTTTTNHTKSKQSDNNCEEELSLEGEDDVVNEARSRKTRAPLVLISQTHSKKPRCGPDGPSDDIVFKEEICDQLKQSRDSLRFQVRKSNQISLSRGRNQQENKS